jgi:hypothetical protein
MAKYLYKEIKKHTDVLLKSFQPTSSTTQGTSVISAMLLDMNYINTIIPLHKIPPGKIAVGKRIMGKLMKKLNLNSIQAAALVGNFYAESAFNPSILQNKHTDGFTLSQAKKVNAEGETYRIGYGFAQWTYSTRQDNLAKFLDSRYGAGKGIYVKMTEDDNVDFVVNELKSESFKSILATLKTFGSVPYVTATSIGFEDVAKATFHIMTRYESPQDQSDSSQSIRIGYAKQLLDN